VLEIIRKRVAEIHPDVVFTQDTFADKYLRKMQEEMNNNVPSSEFSLNKVNIKGADSVTLFVNTQRFKVDKVEQEARQAEKEVRSLKERLEEEERDGQRQEETISRLVKEKEELKDWLARQKKIHQEDLTNIRQKHEQELLSPDAKREDFQSRLITNATDEEGVARLKEALVSQQQQLEMVTREKNNLIHRVEHLEKKSEEQSHGGKRYQMLLDEGLHLEERRPLFLQESPFDGAAARQAKRVYTSIDKLSVRVGATLRRYPVARLFVFLYIVALQLWVLLVLFSQTPENTNSAPDQG